MISINNVWAVAYSPSLKVYRTVKLIELTRINFQAHLRKEDTDFIVVSVAGTNADAVAVCDGIERSKNKVAA